LFGKRQCRAASTPAFCALRANSRSFPSGYAQGQDDNSLGNGRLWLMTISLGERSSVAQDDDSRRWEISGGARGARLGAPLRPLWLYQAGTCCSRRVARRSRCKGAVSAPHPCGSAAPALRRIPPPHHRVLLFVKYVSDKYAGRKNELGFRTKRWLLMVGRDQPPFIGCIRREA